MRSPLFRTVEARSPGSRKMACTIPTCSFPACRCSALKPRYGGRSRGRSQGLPPSPATPMGYCSGINERGPSGRGFGQLREHRAPLPWDCLSDTMLCCGRTGRPETFGNLGGETKRAKPRGINDRGEATGFSDSTRTGNLSPSCGRGIQACTASVRWVRTFWATRPGSTTILRWWADPAM